MISETPSRQQRDVASQRTAVAPEIGGPGDRQVVIPAATALALDDLQIVSDQSSGSSKSKDIVMALAHNILDVTIATVACIVVVSVCFPVYLVAVLASTIVRRTEPSPGQT